MQGQLKCFSGSWIMLCSSKPRLFWSFLGILTLTYWREKEVEKIKNHEEMKFNNCGHSFPHALLLEIRHQFLRHPFVTLDGSCQDLYD